jgi:hypothetical protein
MRHPDFARAVQRDRNVFVASSRRIEDVAAMRIFLVPLIALAVSSPREQVAEPSEIAMRQAFEATLSVQVENVLEFLRETQGPEAVARVKSAGTDRFEIRSFKKLECLREGAGHVCSFAVDVSVINGMIEQQVRGHFLTGQGSALTFIQDT